MIDAVGVPYQSLPPGDSSDNSEKMRSIYAAFGKRWPDTKVASGIPNTESPGSAEPVSSVFFRQFIGELFPYKVLVHILLLEGLLLPLGCQDVHILTMDILGGWLVQIIGKTINLFIAQQPKFIENLKRWQQRAHRFFYVMIKVIYQIFGKQIRCRRIPLFGSAHDLLRIAVRQCRCQRDSADILTHRIGY